MMRNKILGPVLGASGLLLFVVGAVGASTTAMAVIGPTFTHPNQITNQYLPITQFHRCQLAGKDKGQPLRIVRVLQNRTQPFTINGKPVNAAVVKDQVFDTKAHRRIEKTLDYFAQDDAGNVYYLGEDVNEYNKHGKLVSHSGQWRFGRDTQTLGVIMPAAPTLGSVFKSEDVPGIVTETDTVVGSGLTKKIGRHTYSNVIQTREDAAPPPEVEFKQYAPGVGVITEANGGVKLVGCR